MSDDKKTQARERFNDAVANGQIHPAIADYLACLDGDLQGVSDRHEALADDIATREREDREARERVTTSDDVKSTDDPAETRTDTANRTDSPTNADPNNVDSKATPAAVAGKGRSAR